MTRDIVIVGCGGHGREVFSIVQAINEASPAGPVWRVLGFVADWLPEPTRDQIARLGVAYLGTLDRLRDLAPGLDVVVAIGDPRDRREVWQRIAPFGVTPASIVHPAAHLDVSTVTGAGLLVFAGVTVTANVTIGRHVHLNQNTMIGPGCVLADFVSAFPQAVISGGCRLDDGALIGARAVVLPGRRVGPNATVGARACASDNVHSGSVVKGVPAR